MLKNSVDQSVKLTVYSTRTNLCREVAVTPSTGWGGSGLLGVSIRFCSIRAAREAVWHILDVAPNSPAAQAGLISQHDYVIGSDAVLLEVSSFYAEGMCACYDYQSFTEDLIECLKYGISTWIMGTNGEAVGDRFKQNLG